MKKNKKGIRSGLIILILLGIVHLATAQQKTISLEKSKKAALQYSNDIKNGKLRIDQAEYSKKQAISNYFPNVSAIGAAFYGIDDFIDPIPVVLPNGFNNFYLAAATASEPIYAGGKIRASSELADIQVETSKIRAAQSIDSVILLTEQKYWQLVELQERQKVLEVSKAYLDELLKQQQDLLDAGLIARYQLLQVKTNRSQVLLQRSKLNNSRKVALLDFALYVGIPYDTTMVAIDTFTTIKPPQLKYGRPKLDLTSNSNYQLLEQSIEASKLQTQLARADLLPQFSVGISASQIGTFDDTFDSQFQPLAFGTLNIPISAWWGSERQKVRQKEIDEEIAINNLKDGQDQLKVSIMKSWYDLLDAYKQIQYAQENLEYAQENLEVSRDNYNSGLNNLSDLLDAQRTQQQAQTELVNAKANYEEKEILYLQRTDQLETPEIEEVNFDED